MKERNGPEVFNTPVCARRLKAGLPATKIIKKAHFGHNQFQKILKNVTRPNISKENLLRGHSNNT